MEPTRPPNRKFTAVAHVEIPIGLPDNETPPATAQPLIAKVQRALNSAADQTRMWEAVQLDSGAVVAKAQKPTVVGLDIYTEDGTRVLSFGPDLDR
jgi:hypothetical protein